MSFTKLNKRKASMMLYQLEESLGQYVLKQNPTIDSLPSKTINNIVSRNNDIDENNIEKLLEVTYLDEIFHFALEVTKNTSTNKYIKDLMNMFKIYDIFYIRNVVAHPNKQFLDEYWYKIALVASSHIVDIIGLDGVKHALLSAESGSIIDPPEEWLEEIASNILPNNLPKRLEHSITGLVGRTSEEKELLKLLRNLRVPTIAIVAQGGIGKTALVHDILNKLVVEPETSNWCDGIIFIDMKIQKLTINGIENLKAVETVDELKRNIVKEINNIFNDNCETLEQIFRKYEEKKLLLFIDNLETLLRDNVHSFEGFNYSLPREWRILVTSRISISSASIIPLGVLNLKSAIQLAKIYTIKSGQKILSNENYNSIVLACHKNPLAIRLTLDLYISGYELPSSIDKSSKMIAEFSFQNLVEKLSDNSIQILEALFIDENIDRIRLCELLNLSLDEVAETIHELSRTSLISRDTSGDSELFKLSSSIRDLLLSSPRNMQIRNNIQEKLRRVKELSNEIERRQDKNQISEFNNKYIPLELHSNLKILINKLNNSLRSHKIKYDVGGELYKEFTQVQDMYRDEYMFHKSIARLYNALGDSDSAINSYLRAIELNNSDYLSMYLLANIYFHTKQEYNKSEDLTHDIIRSNIIGQDYVFAKQVFSNYFLSCLYQHKYEVVLNQTKTWKEASNNFIKGILGTYRASALRRKLESIPRGNIDDYSATLLEAISAFDELFEEIGYIDIACRQAIKLFDDIEYKILNQAYKEEDKLKWLNFISRHIINISKNFQDIESNYVSSLILKLSSLEIEKNEFKDENWQNFVSPSFSNTISEDYALENDYIIVQVKQIPSNTNYDFSSFIFAEDDKYISYLIHISSLIMANSNDWKLLQIGMKLAIKSEIDDNGNKKSYETQFIE